MSKSIKLSNAVKYSSKRINVNEISVEDFISTDNLLQNKLGKENAIKLPSLKGLMPSYSNENILVGNIRPYLRKIWFADKESGCSADVLVFDVNKFHYPKFIYYTLFRDDFFDHMMKGSKGTKMPRGDKKQILDFLIPDFEFEEQQKIAKVLSDLDAKIENNNRINAELEAMSKTLYDYWFVQFDFPDANGKPYKTSGGKMVWNAELKRDIPEGWESGTLDSIGNIIGGSTPSKAIDENFCSGDGTPWITPKDLSNNKEKKYITRGEYDVTERGLKEASLKIMPEGTVLLSSRAPIGYLAIVRTEVTTNQGFKSFVPKNNFSTEYIYFTIKNCIPEIEANSSGSTFKEVSSSTLKTIKTILPKDEILLSFYKKIKPIFKKQDCIELENQELASLRDWLLPMLMNGQVSVGDVEEENFNKKKMRVLKIIEEFSNYAENGEVLGEVAEERGSYEK
jgi:type I restriction enzyme S subunit